jgi:hypothetical protein
MFDSEEISYLGKSIMFSEIISGIKSNFSLTPTESFQVKGGISFFKNLYRLENGNYQVYKNKEESFPSSPLIREWRQLFDAILPIEDTKSELEYRLRMAQTQKAKKQLEHFSSNPEEYRKTKDTAKLIETCERIKNIYEGLYFDERIRKMPNCNMLSA